MAGQSDVERLIREILEETPEKTADVDRYVATKRFLGLSEDGKVSALSILKSALADARDNNRD